MSLSHAHNFGKSCAPNNEDPVPTTYRRFYWAEDIADFECTRKRCPCAQQSSVLFVCICQLSALARGCRVMAMRERANRRSRGARCMDTKYKATYMYVGKHDNTVWNSLKFFLLQLMRSSFTLIYLVIKITECAKCYVCP